MSQFTPFLFSRPSFFEGCARVLDLGDTLTEYNTALTPEQADAIALYLDWLAVGDDVRHACQAVSPTVTHRLEEVRRAKTK
jgi:hypothetical protein